MNRSKIICAVVGHDNVRLPSPPGVMEGHGGPTKCMRCGHEFAGLKYPEHKAPPPKKESISELTVKLGFDVDTSALDRAIERTERLIELSKQIDAEKPATAEADAPVNESWGFTPDTPHGNCPCGASNLMMVHVFGGDDLIVCSNPAPGGACRLQGISPSPNPVDDDMEKLRGKTPAAYSAAVENLGLKKQLEEFTRTLDSRLGEANWLYAKKLSKDVAPKDGFAELLIEQKRTNELLSKLITSMTSAGVVVFQTHEPDETTG